MSDDSDSSTLPRWEELLRELEETNRRLQSAHADYLEASARSEQALQRIIDAFGDLNETVKQLVPQPQEPSASSPPEPGASGGDDGISKSGDPVATGGDSGDSTAVDAPSGPPPTPAESDRSSNELPARLHSRGIAIPDQNGPSQGPPPNESTGKTGPGEVGGPPQPASTTPTPRKPSLPIDQPHLVDAPQSPSPTAFSGLDSDRRIVLTNDGFGVAPALNEILSNKGYRVRIDSRRPELSAPADTVIFLGSLRAPSDLDDAMSVVDDAMYTAEQMTTRLMQPDSAFVAAIDTGGGFGLGSFEPVTAPYGALLGLIRLLDERHPGASTKLIDIDGSKMSGEQIAQLVARELLEGGDTSPIAVGHDRRQGVEWRDFESGGRPAPWLEDNTPPLVYMPGPDAVMATAVERLAIAHELPVAVLRRRHTPASIARSFDELDIHVRSIDYDLNQLFTVMDFLDGLRNDFGPIAAIIAESLPANNPQELARWDALRPPLDEFNALLAMTINDPLKLLGVGIGPDTPPIVSSALRYFARAESLRRKEQLGVRLAHLQRRPRQQQVDLDPFDFALTEFLAGATPAMGELRFHRSNTP